MYLQHNKSKLQQGYVIPAKLEEFLTMPAVYSAS